MSFANIKWQCTSCKSFDIVEDPGAGDLVCTDCGVVAAERICQLGPDERDFENEDQDRKHNEIINELTDGVGMTTSIHADGSALAQSLRTTQLHATEDTSQARCFREIERLCDRMSIPGCKHKAQELAKLYLDADKKKHKLRIVSAASLYIAVVHFQGEAITFSEFAASAELDSRGDDAQASRKHLWKYYQKMLARLRYTVNIPAEKNSDFISRYLLALDMPHMLEQAQKAFAKAVNLPACNGKQPSSIAAALLYLLCQNDKIAKSNPKILDDISRVSQVNAHLIKTYHDQFLAPSAKFLL
eukprot:NODE_4082_length_1118_cov_138.119598_g3887_i0.p1 GENE.NODE_4082_length_1118_cov_138.119598_g3887_i0~~NODE_4082_length_1118_cov_138.119598_g3887_i0.p1  ORF type:complete len:301 (+),score=35.23 NODE_4082_length_1118_cov_138.119598_g3887_i0:98-1000(+)